jgi:hypothetical protein
MKKITLLSGFLLSAALVFSQENPCVILNSSGNSEVSNNGNNNCTYQVNINATGVSSRKSVRIQVFAGTLTSTPVHDECITVARNTTTTYATATYTAPCDATIFLVITRYTASNGECNGGICAIDTLDASGGPLPIKMSAFYAKRKNSSVTLSWETASELNAKEFVIQKKAGNSFENIAIVAADNKITGSSYSFYDINSFKGVSQYRLKMVDLNGAFTYSEIRAVKGTTGAADFTIFPNPSRGDAKVTITDISEPTDVQLVDNTGRILKVVSMNNSNTVDFSNLQKGMYMIRIVNKISGEALTKKLHVLE